MFYLLARPERWFFTRFTYSIFLAIAIVLLVLMALSMRRAEAWVFVAPLVIGLLYNTILYWHMTKKNPKV